MNTREQFEFQKLGDRKRGRHQKRQTNETVRPRLEKQAYPEYHQIGVWVAHRWHGMPMGVNIISIGLICVSDPTGEM